MESCWKDEALKKNKSERSVEDSEAEMGTGCLRVLERVQAATGQIDQAQVRFDPVMGVENGGVLFALPALLSTGLLKYSGKFFHLSRGYYGLIHIFLLIAFMALSRIKSIEKLRYTSPGEWGKLLGLDRIPEARTLREKVRQLSSDQQQLDAWSSALAGDWLEDDPEAAGVLYVDGHVRVYHGKTANLPKRFVARQKLALRGVTDYWVNDELGRPFFRISSPLTKGLLNMLENEIVPRLVSDVPFQPTEKEMAANPLRHRFIIVFDREGYSPEFFKTLWTQRIACQTYRKFPGEKWPEKEFSSVKVKTPFNNEVIIELAERGSFIGGRLWVREIRKLGKEGHQTAVISTDFTSSPETIAMQMFNRWSQENFFKYMRENYGIDALAGYSLSSIDETEIVINPDYRQLEGQIKRNAGKLGRKRLKFYKIQLTDPNGSLKKIEEFERKKGELLEEIELLERDLFDLKKKRKKTPKKIKYRDLPDTAKFKVIAPRRKQFLDTVKMIAYRAETSMSLLLRTYLGKKSDVRQLLVEMYQSASDIIPDYTNKRLKINLHRMANPQSDRAVKTLCDDLNCSKTVFPGTDFVMEFDLVSK